MATLSPEAVLMRMLKRGAKRQLSPAQSLVPVVAVPLIPWLVIGAEPEHRFGNFAGAGVEPAPVTAERRPAARQRPWFGLPVEKGT